MTVEKKYGENEPIAVRKHLDNCALPAWYEKYKSLTPKTRILEVPSAFMEYLDEDGIRVPSDGYEWANREDQDDDEEGEAGDIKEDEEPEINPVEKFQDFHDQIEKTIAELNGAVLPKLNWSSPKDAQWISTTSNLKCVTPSDIYLLLKASSYIVHDLGEAYKDCSDHVPGVSSDRPDKFYLILREWFDLNASGEFRCFVKGRKLVAITQRDMNYYDYLDGLKNDIKKEISQFFDDNLRDTFPDESFVFDVYIPRPFTKVWLIDINPFARKTDTLLWDWQELLKLENTGPELRLVDKLDSSRGFSSREHTENSMPKEFVDASVSGNIVDLASQLQQILRQQEQEDEDEE